MVSSDALGTIGTAIRIIALAVVAAPSGMFAQPDSPLAGEEALQKLVAQIDEIQSLHGGDSPDLIEPLTELSSLYEERGNYELALTLIAEATHVIEVNHGLHTLDEAELMSRTIRMERARGNAEAAWNEEKELRILIRHHPYDARTIPMLREIADARRAILARYQAGEFPPEIVLGCYYSEGAYDANGGPRRTDCRSGSRRRVIWALGGEAAAYERQAARLTRWAELPCARPEPPDIAGIQRSTVRSGSVRRAKDVKAYAYLVALSNYAGCTQVKYGLAASTKASPDEPSQLASDRDAAVEELATQTAICEERNSAVVRADPFGLCRDRDGAE